MINEKIKREILGIFLSGIAIYIIYILVKKGNNPMDIGVLGTGLYTVLFKLFGVLTYGIPVILLAYGGLFLSPLKLKLDRIKFWSFIFLITLISAIVVTFDVETVYVSGNEVVSKNGEEIVKEILKIGLGDKSGGIIGAVFTLVFFTILGKTGSMIILFTLLLLNVLIITNLSVKKTIVKFFSMFKRNKKQKIELAKVVEEIEFVEEKPVKKIKKIKKNIEVEAEKESFLEEVNLEKNSKKEKEEFMTIDLNKENFEKEKVVSLEKREKKEEKTEKIESINENKKIIEEKELDIYNFDEEDDEIVKDEIEKISEEINIENVFKERKIETNVKDIEKNIKEKILRLENVLDEYGIEGKIVNYERGPAITRFELSVAKGTRVKRIVALTDDIAMNLEAKSIRIEAPIPGKNAIGIEIPNDIPEAVYFSTIYKSHRKKSKSPLDVVLGKNIIGEDVVINLGKMPHLLIAGRTGSGKSVCINTLISSIISNASSDEVRFIMVDPKMVELMPYNGIPHLMVPVIIEPKLAAVALKWAVNEMEDRYKKLSKTRVRNLDSYNSLKGVEKLPYIVVVIDELADLMMVAPGSIEESIARIAQKARAVGIHLVVATQRPSADVITGTIKANLPSRISFSLASQIDSRVILDSTGAEKLLGRGDMLFLESGTSHLVRIQGAFISDDEVNALTELLKKSKAPEYKNEILEDDEDERDELFDRAVAIIKKEQKASTSLIQRKLKVGYSRAARIIDELVDYGIINEDKEVLIDID